MHTHILWGVDDGPKTSEQTMKILKLAVNEGITDIISTSHSYHPQFHVDKQKVNEQIAYLQNELEKEQIPLTLHTGHEVHLSDKIKLNYKAKQFYTLANSNYILLELPSYSVPYYTTNIIRELLTIGLIPIIAHPERNYSIAKRPKLLELLIREGAMAQITAGSIVGDFGKGVQKLSMKLIRANLIHTYGSDVHNLTTRPYCFEKGLLYLEKNKELEYVDILLENNARIILNQPFIVREPEKVSPTKKLNLFSR